MKQSISIFLFFWICGIAYSQNPKVNILRQDLSGLFDNLSMIGILGEDCSRIDIHFTKVRKMDNREYEIKGVSRTRLSIICPFKGKVCIDSISSDFQLKSECTKVDGFIYGHYSFTEYGDKRYSGTFSGAFKQGYRMNGQQIEKGRNEIAELKWNLSEYRGKWKSANGLTKVCSWVSTLQEMKGHLTCAIDVLSNLDESDTEKRLDAVRTLNSLVAALSVNDGDHYNAMDIAFEEV